MKFFKKNKKQIVRYDLIVSKDADVDLFYNVMNQMISEGWQPYGELHVTYSSFGTITGYVQPIILYDGK